MRSSGEPVIGDARIGECRAARPVAGGGSRRRAGKEIVVVARRLGMDFANGLFSTVARKPLRFGMPR